MKYQLETIPVWDAYRADTECPLCFLQRKAEEGYVRFFLGNSVMVPEMRVQVNDTGFCPPHYTMLLGGGNRLGLALITHTHIGELRKKMDRYLAAPASTATIRSARGGSAAKREIAALAEQLSTHLDRCMICDRLAERFKRYVFTIVHLWQHEEEFRSAFLESRGFCLDHIRGLLAMAVETLKSSRVADFVSDVGGVQNRAWDRLDQELLAFTGKFDYQAEGEVSAATKESVTDAIQKLTGGNVPRE